ncbi:hypothetical protein EGW08_012130 [Elysia chlorotica]|uniref:Transporter n=1 Tax=Elysia chlorotica TaxID=188477 RepID=A0A3S1A175_ELYCH|nr:hypothetical protein EGW08_012130 [Elysia chlorotica]
MSGKYDFQNKMALSPSNAEAEKLSTSNSDGDESSEDDGGRQSWSRKTDFVLSCLSYAVGLGNVWRFPYVCYKNGGGAFLIPFLIMLFITGIPLVFMELAFGQFASSGVVSIWTVSPIFQGVGWAMFIISCLIAIYYNMIIAWTLYYFFASFNTYLPWSYCGSWSTEACLADPAVMHNCTAHNGTWYNATCFTPGSHNESVLDLVRDLSNSSDINYTSSSDEYFHKVVLDITPGIDSIGHIKWELALCLLLAWIIVGICLARGIKSSGKAVYFTAFFPYLVLLILLVRGVTLNGSTNGMIYYLTPKWDQLLNAAVWKDAAVQIFFSLSPGWGGLITLASYNKFHNNCYFDAVVVSILDCVTSVFAGLVIFSIIGYMAEELHQSVDKVASDGPGLAFVVYPAAVAKLPISQLWAVLFFAMLITLGLGTQIATVTTVHTTLIDRFSNVIKPGRRSFLLLVAISCVGYLCGLSFCTQGGMYVVQLFDNYAATYSLLATGLTECVALAWVYGCDRFLSDIETMLGKRPHKIWSISWRFVAPTALFIILIFTLVHPDRTRYEDYVFPAWADGIGVCISLASILAIPGVAVYKVVSAMCYDNSGGLQKTVQKLSRPTANWGPRKKEHRMLVKGDNYADAPAEIVTQQPMMLHDYK